MFSVESAPKWYYSNANENIERNTGLADAVLIAFSNVIRYGAYTPPQSVEIENPNRGIIVGVVGTYKDATFEVVDGATIFIVFTCSLGSCWIGQNMIN